MMLEITSKQRSQLRSMCNTLPVILYIGKEGITETVVKQAWDALEARELIKGKVLETAGLTAREACDLLCEATGADPVQSIGTVFVMYKKAPAQAKAKIKKNPIREGARARRAAKKNERERRNQFFHEQAIQKAIERRAARENRD